MSFKDTLNEKVVPGIMKFVNLKAMQALKDGILYTLPLNIIGSLFLLVAEFPIQGFKDFMASIFGASWQQPFYKVQGGTMNIMAVITVIGIAYIYAKNEDCEPLSSGTISLATFFILTNNTVNFTPEKTKDVFEVANAIPTGWLGGSGMITAIIIGLLVGWAYSAMIKKDMKIHMPEGVPEGVVNGFAALIPATIIFTAAFAIFIFFKFAVGCSFVEFIYKVLQKPLQGASDSAPGALLIAFTVPFLWFFGIHGGTTVGGVVNGLLTANTADNAELLKAGTLDLAHGAHIVTQQFYDNFINLTGSGQTLGLTLMMIALAKSAQYRQLGRLAIVPNLFNINEPILFGTPIVMNPIMAVPFIIIPPLNAMILYFTIKLQIIPPMGGALPPWTTPPIFSGFIIGGWQYAAMQGVFVVVSALVYLPFFKKADSIAYADEKAANGTGAGVQA